MSGSIRRTIVECQDELIDLRDYYDASTSSVGYKIFRQRVVNYIKRNVLDYSVLKDALILDRSSWTTIYGGGKRKTFVYRGALYPELNGEVYSGVTHFLLKINRLDDKHVIHDRLKKSWSIDDALSRPTCPYNEKIGLIYKITNKKTNKTYVGATKNSLATRWSQHIKEAFSNKSGRPLYVDIRTYGEDSYQIEVIEDQVFHNDLGEREKYWIKEINSKYPYGLNKSGGGEIGSGIGVVTIYNGRKFSSLEEAGLILEGELDIPSYIIKSRLSRGDAIPNIVRRKSFHEDSVSDSPYNNLWRRWLSLRNSTAAGRRAGEVSERWENYDLYKHDVMDGYREDLNLIRKDETHPWGKENYKWVTHQEKIDAKHGKKCIVDGHEYSSLKAVADKYNIRYSTLKYRINKRGMSLEDAVSVPMSKTSKYANNRMVCVFDRKFDSINAAAKFAAEELSISFEKARDRIRRGKLGAIKAFDKL